METFNELKYEKLDYKKLKKELVEIINEIKKAESYDQFKEAYFKAEKIIAHMFTVDSIVSIRHDVNMVDKEYEEAKKYINEKGASIQLTQASLFKAILKSKFRKQFDEEFGEFLTKKIEYQLKLTNPLSILDGIKENRLVTQYSKAVATCKADFRGEECNFYGLLKHMQSTDREERKEAFLLWANLYAGVADKLDDIYTKLVNIRVKKARHLGFKNYVDYIYLNSSHFDYTKDDIAKFRKNVEEIVVPVANKLFMKQMDRIGVDTLYYYDESLDYKEGNPVPKGTKDEMVMAAKKMYEELSAETGEYFNFMIEHELFDLETKANKRLGGYCTFLPDYKAPFIFSNFNGTSADVDVLTHEAGHAFEAYLSSRIQKSMLSIASTSDINEIHSMSMELFTYPWMSQFFGDDVKKYYYHHLTSTIKGLSYLVAVDEFQHRVFENPKMNSSQRKDMWHYIEKKYLPWRNYDGNEFLTSGGFWMQKQHIFMYPFYYVDYALAEICALQFYVRSLEDKDKAWNDYVEFCKLGGSIGYNDLLKSANLSSPFERDTIETVVSKLMKIIDDMEKNL